MDRKLLPFAGSCAVQKENPWTLLEGSINELARSRAALTDVIDRFCMTPSAETCGDGPAAVRSYHRILTESHLEIREEANDIMGQVNRLRDLLGIQ